MVQEPQEVPKLALNLLEVKVGRTLVELGWDMARISTRQDSKGFSSSDSYKESCELAPTLSTMGLFYLL